MAHGYAETIVANKNELQDMRCNAGCAFSCKMKTQIKHFPSNYIFFKEQMIQSEGNVNHTDIHKQRQWLAREITPLLRQTGIHFKTWEQTLPSKPQL